MNDFKSLLLIVLLLFVGGYFFFRVKKTQTATTSIDMVLQEENDSLFENNDHINIQLKDSREVRDSLLHQLGIREKVILKTTQIHHEKITRIRHNDDMELHQFFSKFETQNSNH